MMLVAVLADTHRRAARARDLPAAVFALAEEADVILHAGDVVDQAVLDVLAEHAPLHAVLGNNDTTLAGVLPERLEVELAGVRVGMVHDSGQATGRELNRRVPDAAAAYPDRLPSPGPPLVGGSTDDAHPPSTLGLP